AATSQEADTPPVLPVTSIRAARNKKQNSQYAQLGFDSLAEVPPEDSGAVSTGKPAGSGTEYDLADVQRSNGRTGERTTDELSDSLGEGTRHFSARRRRVILDEPEPEARVSRDFRITEAHGVGTGGLHEKANAN